MGETTRFWWIRHAPVPRHLHGGTIYGNLDLSCDCSDRAAFEGLARQLPKQAVLVTSHLKRTHETAQAIRDAGLEGPDPLQDADLGEQDFGRWHGTTWDDLRAANQAEMAAFWKVPSLSRPPGGECFADVMIRVAPAMERLSESHAGRDIILVAHGGSIRAALGHALGLAPAQALMFKIDNLSITRIDHIPSGHLGGYGGAWRVATVNRPPIADEGAQ
ncbi:histidine phosphatase family protein [Magnetospira sp. QH-2]|uniref:histidine phosphatase family protein n=1 Tax=Magnetospira sp. (strain QH-2) TaxID=1288970 RepID=UPI0003E81963|nr:histidine phosphatase family protein [Magnetospira sp. QH-2]CCQ72039.1 Alpha-ribazole phosphatase [Magnetospira sp. QH-2]